LQSAASLPGDIVKPADTQVGDDAAGAYSR
jgi:hypothetical protein